MVEAKPVKIDYLLGREWELPQINKPVRKYPISSSLYENQDGSASITFFSPNGITFHSYSPQGHENVVHGLLSSSNLICQNPLLQSS